ncbi:MAG: hypothetical protein EOP48_17150 [Sphingobacteriales bacterium]|nr:MAG: hypothetical protein EOP48_17150 [Sphingobacteriales bacterium]
MTLQELAHREEELYSKVIDLNNQPQSDKVKEQLQRIFMDYKRVHQEYANLSHVDIEALKRGLFIQWYAVTEPNYSTGIENLDEKAENLIIGNLYEVITAGKIDDELVWMLNYYYNWDWAFERLKSFKGFDSKIVSEQNNHLPDKIDRIEMEQRGQMGKYWNSLTKFSED